MKIMGESSSAVYMPYREEKRKMGKASVTSYVALAMIVISVLMLVLPWMGISFELMGSRYSLPDVIDLICSYSGTSEAQFRMELKDELFDMAESLEDEGVAISARCAVNVVESILDGGISPLDAASASSFIGGILNDLVKEYGSANAGFEEQMILSAIKDLSKSVNAAAVFLWIMIVVMVAAMAFAIYALLSGKKLGTIVYAAAVTVMFVVFAVATGSANTSIQDYTYYIEELLYDLRWIMGGSLFEGEIKLFSLTAAPFICLILAWGGFGMQFVNVKPVAVKRLSGWDCSCGAQNRRENLFCTECGKKRSARPCCECGTELVEGALFCRSCGKRVGADAVPAKPRCECGAELVEGAMFCRNCGKRVGTDAAPAKPRCECGAELVEGAVYCKVCGRKNGGPIEVDLPPVRKCVRCGKAVTGVSQYCASCKELISGATQKLTPPSADDLL